MTRLLLAACALFGAAPTLAVPPEQPEIAVEVAGRSDGVLNVKVVLRSSKAVVTDHQSLPWGGRYNEVVVVAIAADSGGEVLPAQAGWDEPVESPAVNLVPGKALTGDVQLAGRVQGADETLRKNDLVVFWTYRLRAAGGAVSNRVGGWLLVPRRAAAR